MLSTPPENLKAHRLEIGRRRPCGFYLLPPMPTGKVGRRGSTSSYNEVPGASSAAVTPQSAAQLCPPGRDHPPHSAPARLKGSALIQDSSSRSQLQNDHPEICLPPVAAHQISVLASQSTPLRENTPAGNEKKTQPGGSGSTAETAWRCYLASTKAQAKPARKGVRFSSPTPPLKESTGSRFSTPDLHDSGELRRKFMSCFMLDLHSKAPCSDSVQSQLLVVYGSNSCFLCFNPFSFAEIRS